MERAQGRHFSDKQTQKIKQLLANTDMSMRDIAQRMGCSSGAIGSINRKFKIRIYNKKRTSWTVNKASRKGG